MHNIVKRIVKRAYKRVTTSYLQKFEDAHKPKPAPKVDRRGAIAATKAKNGV
jgi:hypothetical protein